VPGMVAADQSANAEEERIEAMSIFSRLYWFLVWIYQEMRVAGLLVLVVAVAALAQDANVIELDQSDSLRVETAYKALQKAQADWDKVRRDIGEKYTERPSNTGGNGHCTPIIDGKQHCYKEGFDYEEFQFSKDFRFIVPKPESHPVTQYGYGDLMPHCTVNGICW
jgi:hypothetical protein